jgi:uncharacterized membrane protein YeiH
MTASTALRLPLPVPTGPMLHALDLLGCAVFAVAGAQIAERAGISATGGIGLGTVTGAAGGAVRDAEGRDRR